MSANMKNDRRAIFGWAMYDWANSAYTTTTLAVFLPILFGAQIVPDEGFRVLGATLDAETLFSWMVGIGAIIVFALSPVLGAIGDFSASKLRFLRAFAIVGSVGSMLFFFPGEGAVWPTIILFLIVEGAWAIAAVFYDSFLPHLSTPDTMDRVSSKGFAFGYIGGGLQFLISLVAILLSPEDFRPTMVRIAIVLAGLWWLGFSLVSFRRLTEPTAAQPLPGGQSYIKAGFSRTLATTRQLRRFPQLLLFLIAFLAYNDGVQAVISVSAIYAEDTLKLDATQIPLAFLAVQFVAFGGAFLFARIAEALGTKRAIQISLVLWTLVTVVAYFLPEGRFLPFLGLAATVGLVLGGTQALSRSLYGSMIPEEASAEFYGFYSVFSKFSAIWGPIIFGLVNQLTGSSRQAVLFFIIQFALGFVLLSGVDIGRARASKQHWHFEGAGATVD
jgi:UMF1 family MFS transporter